VAKSLREQPKVFLWDWSQIGGAGARHENFVASPDVIQSRFLIRFAGTPAYIPFGSQDRVTTAPAAMMQPLPIVHPGRITAHAPIQTPSATRIDSYRIVPARRSDLPTSCELVTNVTPIATPTLLPMTISAPLQSKDAPWLTQLASPMAHRLPENATPGQMLAWPIFMPQRR